jgi:hypothetical protein
MLGIPDNIVGEEIEKYEFEVPGSDFTTQGVSSHWDVN